jgi:hypothetical protein
VVSRSALKIGLGLIAIAVGVLVVARYYSAGVALIVGTLALLVLFWGVG